MSRDIKKTINILSLDGGGIRGIVPVIYLKALIGVIRSQTPKAYLYHYLDLVAGTSTGGLIALGLATPLVSSDGHFTSSGHPKMGLDDLLRLYVEKKDFIFTKRVQRANSVYGLFRSKYLSGPLERLLNELFGEATLGQCLVPALITSYDMVNGDPKIFLLHPSTRRTSEDFKIKDIARATSAAPTFFTPAMVTTVSRPQRTYCLIDGGVFANNPALLAYAEAKRAFPHARKFRIISIGTGEKKPEYKASEVGKWGAVDWINPLKGIPVLEIVMDGQSNSADFILRQIPEVEYIRFQCSLEKDIVMDTTRDSDIRDLIGMAKRAAYRDRHRLYQAAVTLMGSS